MRARGAYGLRRGFDDRGRPTLSGLVFRLHRNWIVPGLGALLVACNLVGAFGRSHEAVLGWFAAAYFCVFGLLTLLRNGLRLSRKVSIVATAESLELVSSRRPPIAAVDIVEAKTVPHPGRYGQVDVELALRGGGSITLWLTDEEAGHLLDMLGVGIGERRASFKMVVPLRRRLLPIFGVLCPLWFFFMRATSKPFEVFFIGPLMVLLVSMVLAVLVGLLPGRVVVGADGFTTRWLRRRFYSFADVAALRAIGFGQNAQVTLRDGKKVSVYAADEPDTDADRGALGRALYRHLDEALGRYRRAANAAEAAAHLRRGQRSARDWLAGLDTLVRGGGTGYRVAALTPELLADVTRSADGAPDARVGAAAALVRIGGEEHRNTVRIAAEACAEPHARTALLRLADADSDEMVEAALKEVAELGGS